jgi:hypothetical protein
VSTSLAGHSLVNCQPLHGAFGNSERLCQLIRANVFCSLSTHTSPFCTNDNDTNHRYHYAGDSGTVPSPSICPPLEEPNNILGARKCGIHSRFPDAVSQKPAGFFFSLTCLVTST